MPASPASKPPGSRRIRAIPRKGSGASDGGHALSFRQADLESERRQPSRRERRPAPEGMDYWLAHRMRCIQATSGNSKL